MAGRQLCGETFFFLIVNFKEQPIHPNHAGSKGRGQGLETRTQSTLVGFLLKEICQEQLQDVLKRRMHTKEVILSLSRFLCGKESE